MKTSSKGSGKNVFVGLSGGVDSAVSAALLKKQGYTVTGVFIRIVIPGYPCTAGQDRLEAMRVAAHLQIPFIEIDLSKAYEEQVFRASLKEFAEGETPNPDTECNRYIKFGAFYQFARSRGADYVATGHYAQKIGGKLFAGVDTEKDQSYFLWTVPQEVLERTLFPVGGMHKDMVRARAAKENLPNAGRKDSQGLCFLGPISLAEMLTQELHPTAGNVLSEERVVIGHHHGAVLYTMGQRHGFTVLSSSSGKTEARQDAAAYFVIAKDVSNNTITVSPSRFPKDATGTELTLRNTNWIGSVESGRYWVRFRYRQALIPGILSFQEGGDGNIRIHLEEPHYVPEGQSLVLYQQEKKGGAWRCCGGGIVDKSELIRT